MENRVSNNHNSNNNHNNDLEDDENLLDLDLDLTSGLDTPLKRIINSNSPWTSPSKSPSKRRGRKRHEPELAGDSNSKDKQFHHTFVMKLFDRSVDLAQFTVKKEQRGKNNLYPVCRAWMKNQPHNTNFAPRKRSPTPEVEEKPQEQQENGDEEEQEVKNVYKLPRFEPLKPDEKPIRIAKRDKIDLVDFEVEKIQESENSSLLEGHMKQWQKVRNEWKKSYAENEERYKESMNILKEMFDRE